ncbi:questin oxidase family protein [Streptomyces sp. NPDC050145]|uniref:questin oxidase family protein n=1 Tax=Streptomyces sp. NPDC050145 TaxID=3365602 RepID=UPI0037BC0909
MDTIHDTTGTLDEALQRLHTTGPEFDGWLSNHGPMAVESLVRGGQAPRVHRWLDQYSERLDAMPAPGDPIRADDWQGALGDPKRLADWIVFFERAVAERPWRDVLAEWWPWLLPGIAAGATHPVIRVGHAVRTLLAEPAGANAPRLAELAHGLGYWAARHQPLPPLTALPSVPDAAVALDAVPRIEDQSGGIRARFTRLTAFPAWTEAGPVDPDAARERLGELVGAAVRMYGTHALGSPVMLVHAATAPNAVLRTLPALPRELWAESLDAAWAASAAVTSVYAPPTPAPAPVPSGAEPEEVFARAAAHGNDHAIKFADTALEVGGDQALAAASLALDLIEPA